MRPPHTPFVTYPHSSSPNWLIRPSDRGTNRCGHCIRQGGREEDREGERAGPQRVMLLVSLLFGYGEQGWRTGGLSKQPPPA